jgi:DNA polymerase
MGLTALEEALRSFLDDGLTHLGAGGAALLEQARVEASGCTACKLCRTRQSVVFGQGNPLAALMLVGEGPGADEDRLGRPFVGQAGRLLDELLAERGLDRRSVYIANVVKCRPPRNRDPEPDEIAACRVHLERQMAIIRPRVVVCLGKVAAHVVLDTEEPISRLRGEVIPRDGRLVIPTFHPAYLLRTPGDRPKLASDLARALQCLRS